MIHRVEKLFDVTFKSKTSPSIIFTFLKKHTLESGNSFMSSFANAAGERMRNKSRFKNGVKDSKNCMVKNSIANVCFVNVSLLWILYEKGSIGSMLICFAGKFARKFKYIFLKLIFKFLHILFVSFTLLKLIPSKKQVLKRNYLFKHVFVNFHG